MSETNLEHYKEDLKEIVKINFDNPRGVIKKIREIFGCQIKVESGEYATDAILEWMAQPYKEPILDDVEKAYLNSVIKPFRKKVNSITKILVCDSKKCFIRIRVNNTEHVNLPNFNIASGMYAGMRSFRAYTLEELGL